MPVGRATAFRLYQPGEGLLRPRARRGASCITRHRKRPGRALSVPQRDRPSHMVAQPAPALPHGTPTPRSPPRIARQSAGRLHASPSTRRSPSRIARHPKQPSPHAMRGNQRARPLRRLAWRVISASGPHGAPHTTSTPHMPIVQACNPRVACHPRVWSTRCSTHGIHSPHAFVQACNPRVACHPRVWSTRCSAHGLHSPHAFVQACNPRVACHPERLARVGR